MRLFTPQEIKFISVIVGTAAVIAVSITLIVGLANRKTNTVPGPEVAYPDDATLEISELLIPEEFVFDTVEKWYLFRKPMDRWTDQQVEKYWIDPKAIAQDLLSRETETFMKAFVERIP